MSDAHAQIESLLASQPFESAVGLVTSSGALVSAHGDLDRTFDLASVTKLITTYAALVAIERGALALTDPAGEGTPDGCTVEHLLSHAAGYAFDDAQLLAAPGQRRMYSNAGIEHLGRLVEAAIGTDFGAFVREAVLEPLGMEGVEIQGSPAKDYRASLEDLLLLGREFLRPTLISAALADSAHRVHFPGIAGVLPGYGRKRPNDWGLGPEIKGDKAPHWTATGNSARTFGHFGQAGSFLWVDPDADLAAAFLSDRPFSDAHIRLWPELGDLLLAAGREAA
ncbi:MAG: serine hydrolase domain-containing protein [Dermabacter sp.]|nr:serine hydrolase domain-containing protein [Dermabacter sp.]